MTTLLRDPRRPAPAPERPRHLRVVRPAPAPGRRPPARFLLLAALGTMLALFMVVGTNVLVGQTAVRRAGLEERMRVLRQRAGVLEVEVARLRAPSRIEQRARELGLVPAERTVVLVPGRVAPSPSLGERGTD